MASTVFGTAPRRRISRTFLWLGLFVAFSPLSAEGAATISTGGKDFQGEMITATINTLTINDQEGGYTIVPRKDIVAVEVDLRGGDRLKGGFHDWRDGVCVLKIDDRLVGVQDGLVTFIKSAAPIAAPPSGGPITDVPAVPVSQVEKARPDLEPSKVEEPSKPVSPLDNLGPAHRIQM